MTRKTSATANPTQETALQECRKMVECLAETHAAHVCWRKDGDFWREELGVWQKELERLEADLKKVGDAFTKHASELKTHGASVTLYSQMWNEHEHALANYETGGDGADLPALARRHQLEEEKHDALRAAHERLKRRHHALVTALSRLEKTIDAN